jgi:hypothetical protein
MTQESEWKTLLEVISTLNDISIAYMLTGSLAKTFYATPRMTRDIDIVIQLHQNDVLRVVGAFEKTFYIDQNTVQEAVATSGMFNLIHNQFHVKVDFIVRKSDEFRKLEFSRRRKFELKGTPAWIVSPEDLILSKLYWAKDSLSEMQLGDVKDLLKSVKNLDRTYIDSWLDKLGVRHLLEKVEP